MSFYLCIHTCHSGLLHCLLAIVFVIEVFDIFDILKCNLTLKFYNYSTIVLLYTLIF